MLELSSGYAFLFIMHPQASRNFRRQNHCLFFSSVDQLYGGEHYGEPLANSSHFDQPHQQMYDQHQYDQQLQQSHLQSGYEPMQVSQTYEQPPPQYEPPPVQYEQPATPAALKGGRVTRARLRSELFFIFYLTRDLIWSGI